MSSPWRRHRALELLVETWPVLEGDEPPDRAVLAGILEQARLGWTLVDPREAADGYEAAVADGRIPTRERSWHDTFNVLAFVCFPQIKRALHRRCLELQRARARMPPQPNFPGVKPARSREEDALTLIDETSLVFAGSAEAIAKLQRARAERELDEIDRVIRTQRIRVFVLGHALLEHLALGRPPIGAGVLPVALEGGAVERDEIDRALAERIAAGEFERPRLSPTVPWPDPIVDGWL